MLIDINQVKVSERIRKDYGDIEELANDIKENGLINPPVITPEYELIAGERRLRALQFLNYNQIEVRVMTVKDALHQLKLEISENENRKDFSFSEKMQWAEELKKEYEKIARENMSKGGEGLPVSVNLDSNKKIANDLDMGKETYRQAKYISDNASEEVIKQLDDGQLSINKAYVTLKQEKQQLENNNKELKIELEQERSKEPEIIDNTDHSTIDKLKQDLEYQKKQYIVAKEKEELLNEQIKNYEEDSQNYKNLKNQIKSLTEEKDNIGRQIESGLSLSGYIYDVEDFLKTKLSPIQYSRALLEQQNNPIVIKNVIEIIECVEKWCQETRKYLPKNQQNIINVEEY